MATATLAQALQIGLERQKAGHLNDALTIFQQVLAQDPTHPDALHLSGIIAFQSGELKRALELLKHAASVDPKAGHFHHNLARVHEALGQKKAERKADKRAQELLPRASITESGQLVAGILSTEAARVSRVREAGGAEAEKLAGYQQKVETMRRARYMDFPAHVHLETLAKCNATCNFCPYTTTDRQGVRLEDALIDKVIGDLEDIPKDLAFQFSPFKVNEPFLDVRLFDILGEINARLPNASITLTSNATPITAKVLERLEQVKNVHYLWLSVNECEAENYQRVMGLPFKRTLERLELIHKRKTDGSFTPRVVLSRVGDDSAADTAFINWVRTEYPAFECSVFRRGNWIGQSNTDAPPVPDVGCVRWFDVSIAATGVVAHCCMDGKAEFPIGNVNSQHVLEIYNARPYRDLREHTVSRSEVSPCKECSFL